MVTERNPLEETEKSFQTLIKLASNPECIPSLLDGLANCIQAIVVVSEQTENLVLEKLVNTLLNQIIQVSNVLHNQFIRVGKVLHNIITKVGICYSIKSYR